MEFFGDEIDRIVEFNPLTGEVLGRRLHGFRFSGSHYVTSRERMLEAAARLDGTAQQLGNFNKRATCLEAQRIERAPDLTWK